MLLLAIRDRLLLKVKYYSLLKPPQLKKSRISWHQAPHCTIIVSSRNQPMYEVHLAADWEFGRRQVELAGRRLKKSRFIPLNNWIYRVLLTKDATSKPAATPSRTLPVNSRVCSTNRALPPGCSAATDGSRISWLSPSWPGCATARPTTPSDTATYLPEPRGSLSATRIARPPAGGLSSCAMVPVTMDRSPCVRSCQQAIVRTVWLPAWTHARDQCSTGVRPRQPPRWRRTSSKSGMLQRRHNSLGSSLHPPSNSNL